MGLPGHDKWKTEVAHLLDDLVAQNFEDIYNGEPASQNAWKRIISALYEKYDLDNISDNDSEYQLKQKKIEYIDICLEEYILEEFPHELQNSQVYRFVKQYNKLPDQLPNEWKEFEPEIREQAVKEQEQRDKNFDKMIEILEAKYSK